MRNKCDNSTFALTSSGTTCEWNKETTWNGERMTSRIRNSQMEIFDTAAKSFLKWAGGKSQLIEEIEHILPIKYKISGKIPVYIEPFIGGGALYFYLQSAYEIGKSYIADINPDLILTYLVVQKDVDILIQKLFLMETEYHKAEANNRSTMYYSVRDRFNNRKHKLDPHEFSSKWVEHAADMIFLNKTCFNGLFRQNSNGYFNVPQGSYKRPSISQSGILRAANRALQDTTILLGDFSVIKDYVTPDALIYYDPPYRPLSQTSSFNSYSQNGFTDEDQIRLADFYTRMNSCGAYQVLSNSDPKVTNPNDNFFDDLYANYTIHRISAKRTINANANKRGSITELLITNF